MPFNISFSSRFSVVKEASMAFCSSSSRTELRLARTFRSIKFVKPKSKPEMGANIISNQCRKPAMRLAAINRFWVARILGSTSPKKEMAMVSTTVREITIGKLSPGPFSRMARFKIIITKAILIKLSITSMVVSRRRGCSNKCNMRLYARFGCCRQVASSSSDKEKNAASAPETSAESNNNKIIPVAARI